MNDELLASAWSELQTAWAWRWLLIVAVGSGPALLSRWLGHNSTAYAWLAARRFGALVAVALCLWSLALTADTYRLESGHPGAIVAVPCKVTQAPSWIAPLRCASGERLWASQSGIETGQALTVHVLPWSGLVVQVAPAPPR